MDGKAFIRRARKWASAHDQDLRVEKSRGKGGHQMVYLGRTGRTTVKSGEIGVGLLAAMLKQLGIPSEEF